MHNFWNKFTRGQTPKPRFTKKDNGRVDKSNLNGQTTFAGKWDVIKCRHIALQDIYERQVEDLSPAPGVRKPHRADRRTEQRGTLEQMSQGMNPQLEERLAEIRSGAKENYVVDHAKFGEFFHETFSQMPIPSTRYMLMTSGNHAMSFRLRVKKDPQGQPRYVINFNDPNYTLTDKRVSIDNLEQVKDLQVSSFIDKKHVKLYFGDSSNKNREQTALFQVVDNNFHTQSLNEPRDYGNSDSRSAKMFLSDQKTLHPDASHHLLSAGLPLSEFKTKLDGCPPEQVFSFLAAKSSIGSPGLHAAQQDGYDKAIASHGELVLDAAKKGLIDKQQVFELLAAKSGPVPGSFMAYEGGHAEAISSQGRLVLEAAENNLIDQQQVFELLAAKGFGGMPGHVAAKNNRHTAAVASHCVIVLEAAEKGLIDKQQVSELLPPGWQTANQGNSLWQKG